MKNHILSYIPLLVLTMILIPFSGIQYALAGDAPQILSSDLAPEQIVDSREKSVSFVFVDSDNITEITINEEKQTFKPGTLIEITKTFEFTSGKNLINITATDEAGNKREKLFVVGFGDIDPNEFETSKQKDSKFFWGVNYGLSYEYDTNPSLDTSSPIDIQDIDLEGVVDDSDQPDTRMTGSALGTVGYGDIAAFVGGTKMQYSDSDNDVFDYQLIMIGATYTFNFSESALILGYNASDVNIGDYDYCQNFTFTPNYLMKSEDAEGYYRNLLTITMAYRDFSDADYDDAFIYNAKWERNSLDADKLDNFRSLVVLGYETDGPEENEYYYIGGDVDWQLRWDLGLLVDYGAGLKYKSYPEDDPTTTQFGDTRVDLPIRVSAGVGFEFFKYLRLTYRYKYVFNLSNDSPYERHVHGLYLTGTF